MSNSTGKVAITETSNPLTLDIDISSAHDLVGLLHQCDGQIFKGWESYKSNRIFSEELIFNLQKISEEVVDVLKKKNPALGSVVFSGCGTSGRIGFLVVKSINSLLTNIDFKPCCEYVIAGNDKALLTSQESPEDNPQAGVKALEQICKKKQKVVFFGITCGLSAPFVAGQLQYCMEHLDVFIPVLVGFNPTDQARNHPIEGWGETFHSVVTKLLDVQSMGKGYIINPILGPEAITGSSRMKGGTATKLLLEIIMLNALRQLHGKIDEGGSFQVSHTDHSMSANGAVRCVQLMHMYETVWEETYPQALREGLAEVIDWAGASLNAAGHVYYIGIDSLGLLGLLDAAECPPTYGADVNDIRCFLAGGYSSLNNKEGDLSVKGKGGLYIGANYFMSVVVPSLTSADTVIFLTLACDKLPACMKILAQIVATKCSQMVVFVCYKDAGDPQEDILPQYFPKIIRIRIPVTHFIRIFIEERGRQPTWFDLLGVHAARRFAAEMSCKLLLNAVSTGAHIRKGKVFHNLMVDLKLSNSKLFQRGVEIVKSLVMCSEDTARTAILRSLYGTDTISEELRQMPVSDHVRIGSVKPKVIPTALILASKGCLIHEAMEILLKFPVIRTALAHLWTASNSTV